MDLRIQSTQFSGSSFDCLLFDLDDTLYSSSSGIAEICKRNIEAFLRAKCGFTKDKASNLRVELFRSYGSSFAGLRALGHDVDADDYHSFVHGSLPYDLIRPNHQLRNILQSITQRKLIFTNSDRNHAMKVLERIGIEDCFDQIICFESLNPHVSRFERPDEFPVVLKPSIEAIRTAVQIADTDPCRTLFFDDNQRNIAAGKAVGLQTVLVGRSVKTEEADYVIENMINLRQVIPEIWADNEINGDEANRIMRSSNQVAPIGA